MRTGTHWQGKLIHLIRIDNEILKKNCTMKKESLTRRTFVKKTSIGAAGVALTTGGMTSIYSEYNSGC